MPRVETFVLDSWVAKHRVDSCVSPLSLSGLESLTQSPLLPTDVALSYGPIRGGPQLREHIASQYSPPPGTTTVESEDVLITAGAISANHLILDTLLSPGDHVIVQYPTYGQLFLIPRRVGARVSLWRQKQVRSSIAGASSSPWTWTLDMDDLQNLITPRTKMIILNNPSNPTGLVIPRAQLEAIVDLAKRHDILLMCDEVFRPLFHAHATPALIPPLTINDAAEDGNEQEREREHEREHVTNNGESNPNSNPTPPSLLDLGYDHTLVVSSVSKAYALPGIRVGWIATPSSNRSTLLQRLVEARDYTTIAVSQVDQFIAAAALAPGARDRILARSKDVCDRNIRVLTAWLDKNGNGKTTESSTDEGRRARVRGALPAGAGTCVVTILNRRGDAVDDVAFAEALAKEEGVLAPPAGLCFGHKPVGGEGAERDLKGGLRIGIVMAEGTLEKGLAAIDRLLDRWP